MTLCLADMRDMSFITKTINEKHLEIEIPRDITEDDLLMLAMPIIGV